MFPSDWRASSSARTARDCLDWAGSGRNASHRRICGTTPAQCGSDYHNILLGPYRGAAEVYVEVSVGVPHTHNTVFLDLQYMLNGTAHVIPILCTVPEAWYG